jgi:hypothetical protein
MDVILFAILEVFALVLTLMSLMGNKAGWSLFAIFGGTVSLLTALVLASDGNLTSGSQTIAAANSNFISDFNVLSVLALAIGLAPLILATRRIFHI